VETLGLEEIFEKNAVVLIEWGERFPRLIPPGSLEIQLEQTAEDARRITCNF
jgi:tRNA threonylcarbamoyladenosine biosynthesis protein TsaE